jgi:methylphosphotriester-DNA--protein-cysteine methyltransferase
MRATTYAPGPALAPFVHHYTVVETAAAATRVLIPDTGLVLGLRYGGAARECDPGGRGDDPWLPDAVLTGVRDTARRMHTTAGGGIVLATFRAGGAGAFVAAPPDELSGASVALELLLPRADVERALARVAAADGGARRVAAAEAFLAGLRAGRTPGARAGRGPHHHGDPLVAAAVAAIHAAHGAVHVGELARTLAVSRDRLEQRFRRAVGAPPKRFAALVRLRRALALHRAGASLTRAALDAGYADQSHFVRAFRACTGEPPGRFFRTTEHC